METEEKEALVLGRTVAGSLDHIQTLPCLPGVEQVTATCREVAARCPVTAQPDLYRLIIEYTPRGRIIESKSLKLYLWGFRDRGISCEDLAATVANDLTRDLQAPVTVTARQNIRGGIVLTATGKGLEQ